MNVHEGFNTQHKTVNIKASALLIIHIWSKIWFSTNCTSDICISLQKLF